MTIALAEGGGGEIRSYGTIPNDLHALEKVFAKLRKAHRGVKLRVCYEAGPTGFCLARRLGQLRIECTARPPADLPVLFLLLGGDAVADPEPGGDRIKTDRRDALKLARLHRAGRRRQPTDTPAVRSRASLPWAFPSATWERGKPPSWK